MEGYARKFEDKGEEELKKHGILRDWYYQGRNGKNGDTLNGEDMEEKPDREGEGREINNA